MGESELMVDAATGETVEILEDKVDPNKVQWNENDPDNPQMWSVSYKWFVTALCSFLTINV